MPSDFTAPGLKRRRNRDGTIRLIWVARADLVLRGYVPKTVRLHYNIDDPGDRYLIEAACSRLQAEMLAWACGGLNDLRPHDGSIASLVRLYQTDPASPYRDLKWNTRRTYDQVLRTIEKAFGMRSLAALGIRDLRRWYDEAKKPKQAGGQERIRKAHGIVSMMRRLLGYGVMAELPECGRLARILDEARFKQPGRRKAKLELHHVEAFIKAAIAAGRPSLALGTALQFETTMRQRDVIGEWRKDAPNGGGIVLRGRYWTGGLTWSHISDDLLMVKETTKTGADVGHDLKLTPLVIQLLCQIPADRRVGPVIVDEIAGRPYAEHAYAREWRIIARAAGVPDRIWNMDARAGGISEADEAGADLDAIRSAAGHSQISTTARYVRGTIGKSQKVARMRAAHRNKQ